MIAVLIDSKCVGASGVIAVRKAKRLRVSGLDGDIVRVLFFDEHETPKEMIFSQDVEVDLQSVQFIQAEHVECGKGRVFVDLLK